MPELIDIDRIARFAPPELVGRSEELRLLTEAWAPANDSTRPRVLVFVAMGGEGKTSLVARWVGDLAKQKWPGCERCFAWSFYSQGTHDQSGASAGPFVAAALTFFGGEEGAKLANSPASGRDKASKLLAYLRARRTLLILDGLEPLQYPPGPHAGRLRDDEMTVLLKGLAQNNPGLCVVTTREPVTDLVRYQNSTAPELALECLSEETGADVLRRLFEPATPKGVHHVRSTLAERREIVQAVRGHALTLRLLGGFIHKSLRDVRRWREIDYAQADAEFVTNPNSPDARYGHAFKTIEAYERWLAGGGVRGARQLAVLRVLGLFDRPAVSTSLAALRAEPVIPGLTDPLVGLSATDWNATLSDLEECGLVSVPRVDAAASGESTLDAHPLLREFFARRLRAEDLEAWQAGHRRLFEHLCATTAKGSNPTLDALQPLYQAVAHGCHAGVQQQARDTVYRDRILRGKEFYSVNKLGAFASDLGAVACFFETPWARVSTALTESAQAWLLNQAALCLRALGRLTEALEPLRAGLQMRVRHENWKEAAIVASNLSQLRLSLGDVPGAVAGAEPAVTFADRAGDAFRRVVNRTAQADARHQSGRREEARALFREAERMQVEHQPEYPRLYSLQGFQYCDLLLAEAEHATWGPRAGAGGTENGRAVCREIAARVNQTLRIAKQHLGLLDVALDHLTRGRAALLEALLGGSDFGSARAELDTAVAGLRRAGMQEYLLRGLLARAWLRAVDGSQTGPDSAVSDLDEAWEIAERGPMPLFLADIHLHRARLFFGEVLHPWESPAADLAAAEALIAKHGYHRRDEELADAKRLIRQADLPTPPIKPTEEPMKSERPANAPRAVVVLATGWGPLYGGINAFSFDLCTALGAALKGTARLVCVTANVDDLTRAQVEREHQLRLLTVPKVGPGDEHTVAQNARDVLKQAGITATDLVIGHDVVTGPAALALCDLTGGRSVVFHHMSYGAYQAVKKDGRTALDMEDAQRTLLRKADVVIAVGPLLRESAESLVGRAVPMVVPGLANITPVERRARNAFRAIAFGRMGGGDDPIKQGALAVAGYGRYVKKVEDLKFDRDHRFTMYGLPLDQYAREEQALRALMRQEAERQITVNATVYTDDRAKLHAALADSEVALMLSWHEGFGLVGWEAIAAEVPLVVSRQTGLYKLLKDDPGTLGADCVHVVNVRGSHDGAPDPADIEDVARELVRLSADLTGALGKARKLREHLADKYTWANCAREMLRACEWEPERPAPHGRTEPTTLAAAHPSGASTAAHAPQPPAPSANESRLNPQSQKTNAGLQVEILDLFRRLKTHQFGDLCFLLNMPAKLKPSGQVNYEQRKTQIIDWAAEEEKLDDLLAVLKQLVEGSNGR